MDSNGERKQTLIMKIHHGSHTTLFFPIYLCLILSLFTATACALHNKQYSNTAITSTEYFIYNYYTCSDSQSCGNAALISLICISTWQTEIFFDRMYAALCACFFSLFFLRNLVSAFTPKFILPCAYTLNL